MKQARGVYYSFPGKRKWGEREREGASLRRTGARNTQLGNAILRVEKFRLERNHANNASARREEASCNSDRIIN